MVFVNLNWLTTICNFGFEAQHGTEMCVFVLNMHSGATLETDSNDKLLLN